jgi:hypothetical protein
MYIIRGLQARKTGATRAGCRLCQYGIEIWPLTAVSHAHTAMVTHSVRHVVTGIHVVKTVVSESSLVFILQILLLLDLVVTTLSPFIIKNVVLATTVQILIRNYTSNEINMYMVLKKSSISHSNQIGKKCKKGMHGKIQRISVERASHNLLQGIMMMVHMQ